MIFKIKITLTQKAYLLAQLTCFLMFYNVCYSQNNRFLELTQEANKAKDLNKLKAAEYLINNIPGKVYFDGPKLRNFDQLFEILKEIQKVRKIDNQDYELQLKMDSLIEKYGMPEPLNQEIVTDSKTLTKEFLSANLNYAFKVKTEKKWLENISEEIFNEYILPYRVGTERLEKDQRASLYNFYNFIKKSSKARQEAFEKSKSIDQLKFAADVQYEISRKISTNGTMWGYPFDIPISKMEIGRQGACRHLVNYTTSAMRSVGLPVTSDFTIRWGNGKTGHKWNVLFLENGKELPFDAANSTLSFNIKDRKVVKVYREQFSKEKNFIAPPGLDVPTSLYDAYWKDVTKKYTAVANVTIGVPENVSAKKSFVLIGTFNNSQWEPQFFARIIKGKATFNDMGIDNVYIGMYLSDDNINTFGDPFKVDSLGNISTLTPKKISSNLFLTRKYPRSSWVMTYESSMVGGRFEYSKNENFSSAELVHTINQVPDSVVKIPLNSGKHRYLRYVFPDSSRVYVAEISFFNKGKLIDVEALNSEVKQELSNVNDLILNTYYWGKKGEGIIYDFGEPIAIDYMTYTPRSDSNFIVEGNVYELCYWQNDKWVSLGEINALSSNVRFKGPENALFILHNLTNGREERIFTYENGRQVWW